MELKELTDKILELFNTQAKGLPESIFDVVINNKTDYMDKYLDIVSGNVEEDLLQKIWQYYLADREGKKQDYTPKCLAELVGKLSETDNEEVVLDLCAGSGALTIQKWNSNKELKFICVEIDEKVIPLLLFNLMVRNIDAYVIRKDSLNNSFNEEIYRVSKGNKYGKLNKVNACQYKADTCICNPPYNLKWDGSLFGAMDPRFILYGVPPKSNANFAFILTALDMVSEKASFILPNNVLSSTNKDEVNIIKNLIDMNIVESVILNPNNMFESTSIPTCMLTLNKKKQTTKVEMIDMSDTYVEEIREQRGQFGGNSHTNRVYKKTVKSYSTEQIQDILSWIKDLTINENATQVEINNIKSSGYELRPRVYIQSEAEVRHREYEDIVNDLNRIRDDKNSLKLSINENLARSLGFDVELFKQKNDIVLPEQIGHKIKKESYITFTKNKNQLMFENKSSESVNPILMMILNSCKEFIYYLNIQENRYLAELRDKLLSDLMTGKIEV